MVEATTTGLVDSAAAAEILAEVQWAAAGGSANAITAAYDTPNTGLTDGLILGFRASATNTTATPTFAPDGLTAHTITRGGGSSLKASDILQNGEYFVRYNLANTRWELLNPAQPLASPWVVAGGTADAITATYAPAILSLTDGLELKFRATGGNTITNPTFAPNGLTAHAITRAGGAVLLPGDIPAANAEVTVRYNLANTRWELVNPASPNSEKYFYTIAQAGSDVNTAQAWSPTSLGTLQPGVYAFEGILRLSRAAGANSHTTGLLFGGTATINNGNMQITASTGDALALGAGNIFYTNGLTISAVSKAASTSTTEQAWFSVRGFMTITVAGTVIPQFIYSAAPGGAPTVTGMFRIKEVS